MKRIFTTLAILNSLALLLSFGLGLPYLFQRMQGAEQPVGYHPLGSVTVHFIVGLFTAVLTLLVHCLIFTYSLGTGRWVKEVALAYGLADERLPRQTRELKRWAFPPALFAMLAVIATAAAGAGAQLAVWPWWVHFALACLTLVLNGWAFCVEYRMVCLNGAVIDEVMSEVTRLQAAQGVSDASAKRR